VTDPEPARDALAALCSGGFVVMMESREPGAEGNLIFAAQFASADSLRTFSTHTSGPLYLCLTDARCAELGLPVSDPSDEGAWQPGSIAVRGLAGTGSSRDDQARTIQAVINPTHGPDDFVRSGFVHPVRSRPGGVLQRAGRAEAAVDVVRLSGCQPATVLSFLTAPDGEIARGADLLALAERHGFPVVTVGEVIALRRQSDKLVERVANARLPTTYGEFTVVGFRGLLTDTNHLALVRGDVDGADDVLVRVHTECLVGDVFQSQTCNCARDLDRALAVLGREERGVLVYVVPGDGLRRFSRHESVDGALRPPPMDEYGVGAQILADLGLSTIRILTNHPKRNITGLDGFGLEIVDQVPLSPEAADDAADPA
jgi:3,4-dihydroxy 2-butanone 4-phosphate synthase / GTP cyclohydrolase II